MDNNMILTDLKELDPVHQKLFFNMLRFMKKIDESCNVSINFSFNITSEPSSNKIPKNSVIIALLQKFGPLTSDQIINQLINDGVFNDNQNSKANIRSRLSRLVKSGIIFQESWGEPFQLSKQYERQVVYAPAK